MANRMVSRRDLALYGAGVALGLLISGLDQMVDEISPITVLVLLLLTAGVFGAIRPERAWQWAFLVGSWVPLVMLLRYAIGYNVIHPNTLGSVLLVFPVAIGIGLVGSYGGVLLRRAVLNG